MDDQEKIEQHRPQDEPQDGDATPEEGNWDVISFSEEDAQHADDDIASALAALGQFGMDDEDSGTPTRVKKKPTAPSTAEVDKPAPVVTEKEPDEKWKVKLHEIEEKYQAQIRQLNAALRGLHSKLDVAESTLSDEQKKAQEAEDRLVRVSADYQNFQKRSKAKLNEFIEMEQMKILRSFLPIADNFRRALDHTDSSQGLKEGIELIYKQLSELLVAHQITEIPGVGESFDPVVHDAIDRRSDPGQPDNIVLEVFARGYMIGAKVLKPAQVLVNYLPQSRNSGSSREAHQTSDADLEGTDRGETSTPEDSGANPI